MLKAIKSIINRKRDFLESADIILEDVAEEEINDMVTDAENSDSEEAEDGEDDDTDKDGESTSYESDDVYQSDNTDESLSSDDWDEPNNAGDGMGNSDDDDLDDIFNVSFDMRTNTFSDILPTPPPNASDAVAGDVMSMKVDSGFDGDESDIMNEPIENSGDSSTDNSDIMNEPLSSDDDMNNENIMNEPIGNSNDDDSYDSEEDFGKEEADPMAGFQDEHVIYERPRGHRYINLFEAISDGSDPNAAPQTDVSAPPTTTPPPEPPEESEVTSAVKDNVNDNTDSSTDYNSPPDSPTDSSAPSGGPIDKKGLFKKLTGLQKSIDDIKGSIIDSF